MTSSIYCTPTKDQMSPPFERKAPKHDQYKANILSFMGVHQN